MSGVRYQSVSRRVTHPSSSWLAVEDELFIELLPFELWLLLPLFMLLLLPLLVLLCMLELLPFDEPFVLEDDDCANAAPGKSNAAANTAVMILILFSFGSISMDAPPRTQVATQRARRGLH